MGIEDGGERLPWTPEPWSLPHFAKPDVNCECGYVLTDHLMGAVCTVHVSGEGDDWTKHGDNPRFEEAVANAYLISAAPMMAKAIRAYLDAYDAGTGTVYVERQMRAAFARAYGTESILSPTFEADAGV